jgi:hypothetical protein
VQMQWFGLVWYYSALVVINPIIEYICLYWSVKSIFENPVLFDSDLACRNKCLSRAFGIGWAGFGIGLGF